MSGCADYLPNNKLPSSKASFHGKYALTFIDGVDEMTSQGRDL
jgi:hypothetical protein